VADARGVLDSNLLASALVSPHGPGNALVNAARLDRFQLVVSPDLVDEVRRTLVDDFAVTAEDADNLVALVTRFAEVRRLTTIEARSRDEKDDHILALAEESGAFFLATYDHDLMAVRSVGSCGVVHPVTALQLVANLNAEEWAEGIPGVAREDRSRWRNEDGGAAFDAACQFVVQLQRLPRGRAELARIVAPERWRNFQEAIGSGVIAETTTNLAGLSRTVRYPAEGMAYVFGVAQPHPDQVEPVEIFGPALVRGAVITLLSRDGRWVVYGAGLIVAPAEVGLTAY
jgi:putative PIN family toxin of toxin-antitoxin system